MAMVLFRQDDGATLVGNVMRVGHRPVVQLTQHPIEDGSSVVDHAVRQPLTLLVTLAVTETPYTPAAGAVPLVGAARLQAARDWLDESIGRPVTLLGSKLGDKRDLLIQSYAHDEGQTRALVFDMVLQQVEFATVLTVEVPVAVVAVPGAASAQNLGQQGAEVVDDAQAAAKDKAIMRATLPRDRSVAARVVGI